MKILELRLLAFGPFTDFHLDFTEGERELHVLFGLNEAGKSSALRGLKALLYGIPERTSDNFRHDHAKLRIGGRICHSDSTELSFIRRKGRKDTLLNPDGKPIGDSSLDKFLQGVGEELFSNLFGIDHEALRRGGQEILAGRGEMGQSLFAAGLGRVSVRQILQNLEAEADKLFLPRGKNQQINKALKEYDDAKREIQTLSVSSREWLQHEESLKKAEEELGKVRDELERLSQEKNRLERLQRARPKVAQRTALCSQLQKLGDVVRLPPEFAKQRQEALHKLETALDAERSADLALEQKRREFQGLAVPEELLEQAETITVLHECLGGHRKAAQDRPGLQGRRRQLENDARSLLDELQLTLPLEEAKRLIPKAAHRARIQELGGQYQALVDGLDWAMKAVQDDEKQLTGAIERLQALEIPQDTRNLRRVVAKARQDGAVEEEYERTHTELQAEEKRAQVELKQLGLWSGTLEELEGLSVPLKETMDQVEAEFATLHHKMTDLGEQIKAAQAEIRELGKELAELEMTGAVPSEEELMKARARRVQLWDLVRRAWVNQEEVSEAATTYDAWRNLPEAYEHSVGYADEVADRLRREADRVAKRATLVAQQAKHAKDLEQREAEQATVQDRLRQLDEGWRAFWQLSGIRPLSPREMRAWMDRYNELLRRAKQVRECHHKLHSLSVCIDNHCAELSWALEHVGEAGAAAGETLDALLARSETLIEAIDDVARRRKGFQEEVERLQSELDSARQDRDKAAAKVAQWRMDWAAAVANLGLEGAALPAEANAVVTKLDELSHKLRDAEELTQRINGIDRDARDFEGDVTALISRIAPDLLDMPADQAATQLHARLNKARPDAVRKTELQKQIQEKELTLQEAGATIRLMRERLDVLCRQAGCSHSDELPDAEMRSGQFQTLHNDIEAIEQQLLEQGGGVTLDQLIQEVEATDADAVPVQLSEIARQIEQLDYRRSELERAIGSEQKSLSQMNGSARAAEAAEKMQSILAEIRESVDRYVCVRLASLLLQREIERYREKNQGPLLSRASDLFAQLTLGSFSRLQSDYNEEDEPVLVGIRPSEERIHVEGMSDGTRDQLYLALRLASLERYLASSEPLPFVVDDILIQFDDLRAEATLKVLAQLSAKTQVIFFTHHWRLVELAQKVGGDGMAKIHRLGV